MNQIQNYLSNVVKNYAIKNWRLYSFKQEWLSIIILVLAVKLITSVISVFSGYFYLESVFFGLFNSDAISRTFAVITLIMIECLNALFLAKFFKFIIRMNNFKWIFPLLFSIGMFSLSFGISCNGIAMYTAGKVDLTKNIESKYLTESEIITSDYNSRIAMQNENINTIKMNPTEWKDGRRSVLSKAQLEQIKQCYDNITTLKKELDKKIAEIQSDKIKELHINQTNTENEASKFYKYVSAIMLIQLLASLALWFFWCKISGEDAPENDKIEQVKNGLVQIENTVDGCIDARVMQKLNILKTIYNNIASDNDMKKVASIKTSNPFKIVGFNNDNNDQSSRNNGIFETQKNANTFAVSDDTTVNTTCSNAVCAECGKALTDSQIVRKARFCSAKCRVSNYNKNHPERKKIIISDSNLKD